jgi:hypothetical protein
MELGGNQAIFIGFKLDSGLRRQIDALTGPDRRYVSDENSTFLSLCRRGEDVYVGKIVDDGLTTSRVDDVKRNVLSIMRRLCPESRFPQDLELWVTTSRDGQP